VSKRRIFWPLALLGVLLTGCFDVSDEVWRNTDGSARLRRTVRLTVAAEAAKAKCDAINESTDFARIEIRRDPRVKSFDASASYEGATITVTEDLTVADAKDLNAVHQWIAHKVKADGATFEWAPAFAFEKLPSGNTKFTASIADVKPPAGYDKEQSKTIFGDRIWSLRLYGASIATAVPQSAVISNGQVEWKTPLADLASGQVKETELLAEIGPPFPTVVLAALGGVCVVFVLAVFIAVYARNKKAFDAERRGRPPAPRVMPDIQESGAIPRIPSDEALLSDASEINVDADEDVPTAPLVTAQAAADAVIKFKCPKCSVELKIPLHLAGRQGKCRKCGGAFVSPVPPQLKQVRAAAAAAPAAEAATLREAFSVKKVKCSCGMTSAILRGRGNAEERCPACNQVLVLA
jgi:hypothetical protein